MPNSYEHSYQHDLDNVIDASDAVLAIGTEKVDTTTLKDRSLSNDAAIHGAMLASGYFLGRRFTLANVNYLDCGNDASIDITGAITIICLTSRTSAPAISAIVSKTNATLTSRQYSLETASNKFGMRATGGSNYSVLSESTSLDIKYFVTGKISSSNLLSIGLNARTFNTLQLEGVKSTTTQNLSIGCTRPSNPTLPYDGIIYLAFIYNGELSDNVIQSIFNTIARLQLYSHNFERYPNSDTSLTSVFPYTSGIITSGSFNKTDGLKCTSAGNLHFSNSFGFDGSEEVRIKINGTVYTGAGTITQGNTTVAITQGSNNIDVTMGTNDILEEIEIRFRPEV